MDRYTRNASTIRPEETQKLHDCRVAVIGLGGLGGYVAEMLARAGVGHIVGVDRDRFEVTNLNRQLFSTEENLGLPKAEEAAKRIKAVNPQTDFLPVWTEVTAKNAYDLLEGCHLAVDCCDNIATRLAVEEAAHRREIPLVHGAIGGWFGQVGVSRPGDRLIARLYEGAEASGAEQELGCPPFIPAAVAAFQVAEILKVLLGKEEALRGEVLYLDLLHQQFDREKF